MILEWLMGYWMRFAERLKSLSDLNDHLCIELAVDILFFSKQINLIFGASINEIASILLIEHDDKNKNCKLCNFGMVICFNKLLV